MLNYRSRRSRTHAGHGLPLSQCLSTSKTPSKSMNSNNQETTNFGNRKKSPLNQLLIQNQPRELLNNNKETSSNSKIKEGNRTNTVTSCASNLNVKDQSIPNHSNNDFALDIKECPLLKNQQNQSNAIVTDKIPYDDKLKCYKYLRNKPIRIYTVNKMGLCNPLFLKDNPTMTTKEGGKAPLQCICQICTCGKHRCPCRQGDTLGQGFGPDVLSEYKKTYVPHKQDRVEPFAHKHVPMPEGEMSDKTTHRMDYIPHPLSKRERHEPDVYQRPQGDIDDTTMYKQHYTPKKVEKMPKVEHVGRVEPAAFEGNPTYRSDFREWPIPEVSRHKPDQYRPCVDDFDGLTSYNKSYKRYNEKPTPSCKPDERAFASDIPFDDVTNYRQTYIKHPYSAWRPTKEVVWSKPTTAIDDVTTHKKDFTPKEILIRESCKPKLNQLHCDEPISDITTHRHDYQKWGMEPVYRHETDKYVPPEGELETYTTYKKEYHPYPDAMRAVPVKDIQRKDIAAPFDGETNYRTTYRNWNTEKPERMRGTSKWTPPTDPIDDKTTHRTVYIPHDIVPVKSCKPDESYVDKGPCDINATTYSHDYVHKSTICPVLKLNSPAAEYAFVFEAEDGHHYHEPLFVTVLDTNTNNLTNIPIHKNKAGELVFRLPGSDIENVITVES